MSGTTLDRRHFTTQWLATCPICDTTQGPDEVKCGNCGKHSLQYFREIHSHMMLNKYDSSSYVRRTEPVCGLKCSHCGVKFKSLICINECGIISLERVLALL